MAGMTASSLILHNVLHDLNCLDKRREQLSGFPHQTSLCPLKLFLLGYPVPPRALQELLSVLSEHINAQPRRDIIPMIPVQRINPVQRVPRQLKVLKVLRDPGRRHRLGQHGSASLDSPLYEHPRRDLARGLGDGDDLGIVDGLGEVVDVVPRGGVGGDQDVLLLGPCDEFGLLEVGVRFDLVDCWLDLGAVSASAPWPACTLV